MNLNYMINEKTADPADRCDYYDYYLAQRAAMGGIGRLIEYGENRTCTRQGHVFAVTNAVLAQAGQPSLYFRALQKMGCLKEYFPEIAAMIDVPQNPRFHPEGDVFIHSMLVLDCAASLRRHAKYPIPFMYSALLHDLGKCTATRIDADGRITAYGHEVLGDDLITAQMRRICNDDELLRYVLNQTHLHMRPNMLYGAGSKKKKTRGMFDLSACPEDLILLSKADAMGKRDMPYDTSAEYWLLERLEDYRQRSTLPMVNEEDLREMGIEQERIPAILARSRVLHFSGIDRKRVLKLIMHEIIHGLK